MVPQRPEGGANREDSTYNRNRGKTMNTSRLLSLLVCLGLAACEQVVVQGPVGGATLTITELNTGNVVGEGVTEDEAALLERVGEESFAGLTDAQKLNSLGTGLFATPVSVAPRTLYLVTASGGSDYDVNSDKVVDGPTPVQGSVHAVITGTTFIRKQYAVSALSEAAYQVVVDHIDFMTDEEVQATLDEVARAMVNDADASGSIDYADLLRVNYVYLPPVLQVSSDKLDDLGEVAQALASGTPVQDLALEMFADDDDTALAEVVYEASVAPVLEARGCASSACHAPGGSGDLLSDNVLLPSSNPEYVSANTDNFKMIAESEGVQYILDKVSGAITHPGAAQSAIAQNSAEGEALEAWLKLL